MAFTPDRQRQLELEAEAELELEQEQFNQSFQRSDPGLGADYSKSYGENALKSIIDLPEATWESAKGAGRFISDPVGTVQRTGAEGTLRTVGSMGAGVAGAASLGALGAGWGTALGPIGTLAGGAIGSGLGFATGLFGYNNLLEGSSALATGDESRLQPFSDQGKDFVYNATQGMVGEGAFQGAKAAYGGLKAKLGDPFTAAGADKSVGEYLNKKAGPGAIEKIDSSLSEGMNVGQAPSFMDRRSLGEILDSDVLKNEQRSLARMGSDQYGRAAEATRARNSQQLKYLDDLESSRMTSEEVQSIVQEGIDNRLSASQRGVSQAELGVTDALSELPEKIDSMQAGQEIRETIGGKRSAARRLASESFDAAGNQIIDPSEIASTANELLPDYYRQVGDQPNTALKELISDLQREGEPILMADGTPLFGPDGQPYVKEPVYTMQDLQALRSKAQKIARSGDKRAGAVASRISQTIDDVAQRMFEEEKISPDAYFNWRSGIDRWREAGEVFDSKASPSKKVLAPGNFGTFAVPDSAVPKQFFRKGKGARESMINYKRAMGATEEALEPIYRDATTSFRELVVDSKGQVNAKLARKWLSDHAEALKETPVLQRLLSDVERRQTFLNEKFGDMKRSQLDVEKSAVRYFLEADPEQAAGKMLSGQGMVKRTMKTVQYLRSNAPEALEGLKRGVIEHLKKKSFIPSELGGIEEALTSGQEFKGNVLGGTFANDLRSIEPALKRSGLFTQSQIDGFATLYKDKRSQLSVENAKMSVGSDTVANASVLAALNGVARKTFLRTLPGGAYLQAIEPILKAIPGGKFISRLEEALLDPRLARDLMQKATAKNVARTVEMVFQDELNKAFGDTSKVGAGLSAAGILSTQGGVIASDNERRKTFPRQQQVTASKSFPNPEELLTPASPAQKKTSFNVKDFIDSQPAETRARISVESSDDINAVSAKGARGLSQIMPETGAWIAKERGQGETYTPLSNDMSDAEKEAAIRQNVEFGNWYFNWLKDKYNGNDSLARAAYNAGQGRIDAAIRKAGTSSDAKKIFENLPPGVASETVPYVMKIESRLNQRG